MKEKRKYTKRSDYWNQFTKDDKPIEEILRQFQDINTLPETAGESFYVQSSQANANRRSSYSGTTSGRRNTAASAQKANSTQTSERVYCLMITVVMALMLGKLLNFAKKLMLIYRFLEMLLILWLSFQIHPYI